MVEISLEVLIEYGVPSKYWPPDFAEMVKKLDASRGDRTLMATLSDWCGEHDYNNLAVGLKYLSKHPDVTITKTLGVYRLDPVPDLENISLVVACRQTIMGPILDLGKSAIRTKEKLEAKIKELE